MKTTLDLPDPIMRRVKIRAASEGRKLKDLVAELLAKGMDAPPTEQLAKGEPSYVIDPKTGMAMARTLGTLRSKKVTLAESLAASEQANEEDALSHVGQDRQRSSADFSNALCRPGNKYREFFTSVYTLGEELPPDSPGSFGDQKPLSSPLFAPRRSGG